MESGLVRDVQLINEAAADPEVLELRRSSSRGGEERLRDLAALAGGDAGAANRGEEMEAAGDGRVVAAPALVSIGRLSEAAGKSRAMSEGLWLREFLGAYRQGTGEERTSMVEGLSKGAGVALLAVPMVPAFTFWRAPWGQRLHFLVCSVSAHCLQVFGVAKCSSPVDEPLRAEHDPCPSFVDG